MHDKNKKSRTKTKSKSKTEIPINTIQNKFKIKSKPKSKFHIIYKLKVSNESNHDQIDIKSFKSTRKSIFSSNNICNNISNNISELKVMKVKPINIKKSYQSKNDKVNITSSNLNVNKSQRDSFKFFLTTNDLFYK